MGSVAAAGQPEEEEAGGGGDSGSSPWRGRRRRQGTTLATVGSISTQNNQMMTTTKMKATLQTEPMPIYNDLCMQLAVRVEGYETEKEQEIKEDETDDFFIFIYYSEHCANP